MTVAAPTAADVVAYTYTDEQGVPLYDIVRRRPLPDGKKRFQARRRSSDGKRWLWNLGDARRVPFRLPELVAAVSQCKPVVITEGEKDVENLQRLLGDAAAVTTSACGASWQWPAEWAEHFRGTPTAYVIADNDAAGRRAAVQRATVISTTVTDVRVISVLPGASGDADGFDVSDFIERGATVNDVWRALEAGQGIASVGDSRGVEEDDQRPSPPPNTTADVLSLVEGGGVELFRDGHELYATFRVREHNETWRLRDPQAKHWLRRKYYLDRGKALPSANLEDVWQTLTAKALYDGPDLPVALRVGGDMARIVLDLGDDDWTAVEITAAGWDLTPTPSVKFRRSAGQRPLPKPDHGGTLDELREFLNIDEKQFPLLPAWLLAAFRPTGPYPVLVIAGEQGSAKSTTTRALRALIDPNKAPLRAQPHRPDELHRSASNAWVLAYENVSQVAPWFSDGLCTISTGGGFVARKLYSDDDEMIFDAARPIMLNGIGDLLGRPDLLDRALLIELPSIPPHQRREESEYWREFKAATPRILGALLDAVSLGIRELDATPSDAPPRMADFDRWARACESAYAAPDSFRSAYAESQGHAVQLGIESSPLAVALVRYLEDQPGPHSMVATDWCRALEESDDDGRTKRDWPANGRAFSSQIKRLAPDLRTLGIEVSWERRGQTRSITISKVAR